MQKNVKEMRINLKDMKTASGKKIDPSRIRMAGFTTTLSNGQSLYMKEIVLVADPAADLFRVIQCEIDNGERRALVGRNS